MLRKVLVGAWLAFCSVQCVWAEDIQMVGTIPLEFSVNNMSSQATSFQGQNKIRLLKLLLSNEAHDQIEKRVMQQQESPLTQDVATGLPRRVQLGMNRVPPLNQGNHGACVTFAVTAAIDAILGKGDYISQLCQLELGSYLEHNGYTSSGWDGSWGRIVLAQLDMFGFTPISLQRSQGCGDLKEYPLLGDTPASEMSPPDFHTISESLSKNQIAWSSLLEVYQASSDEMDSERLLEDVKQSLNSGDRLTFGVLLADVDQGIAGAVGTYHQSYDTWVLTPEIIRDIEEQHTEFAGHEMIIIGYDDDATAQDKKGRVYKGLLTLRNSWGSNVGDQGNFYMTYDFFKSLTIEVQRIRQMN